MWWHRVSCLVVARVSGIKTVHPKTKIMDNFILYQGFKRQYVLTGLKVFYE